VLAALNHQQPDRVPVDLSGHRSSGISAICYAKVRRLLGIGLDRPLRVYDPVQQLAVVDDEFLERIGADVIELGRGFSQEPEAWAPWVLPDGTPCEMPVWSKPERSVEGNAWVLRSSTTAREIARMPDGALYFEQTYFPFQDNSEVPFLSDLSPAFAENMWAACAAPPGPGFGGGDPAKLEEGARKLRAKYPDKAINALFGGNLFETGQHLFRADNFMAMLAGEPERAHTFLDALVAHHEKNLVTFLKAVGPYIDILLFGDDLGMQTGPMLSPRMYREFFKPRHARLWKLARELAPHIKLQLHCCGGVKPLLADIIDAGMDAINPVQITCSGMKASELKAQFGSRITLWGGGCDTRSVLPCGTPAQVAQHVREQVAVLSPGGGFIFQQVHNILADVPAENVIAMYDTLESL
jgi:uroporphyrinogen decarboxylase